MDFSSTPILPYGKQTISEDDIAAVVEVLRSEYLTQGPTVPHLNKRPRLVQFMALQSTVQPALYILLA